MKTSFPDSLAVIVLILILAGCQQAPTKIFESKPAVLKENSAETPEAFEIKLSEKTLFIDARNPFDYAISHLNGSINLRPEDFNQRELPFLGLLEKDRFALARRLALKGIDPETPVVVLGKGLSGAGEEGRVAWNLKVLGLKDVQFASLEAFSLPLTNAEAPPRENAVIWKPLVNESLEVSKEEFLRANRTPKNSPSATLIIDVRLEAQYLGKSRVFEKEVPDVGGINIPWTEFFDKKGLVKSSVKNKLGQVGISTEKIIYVISNQGNESAAVTMALRQLGYSKAANFAGGYQQLIYSAPKKKK